jgi:hypothetical protein
LSAPKVFFVTALAAFSLLGVVSVVKKQKSKSIAPEITSSPLPNTPVAAPIAMPTEVKASNDTKAVSIKNVFKEMPVIDRMYQLFNTGQNKLPIVETLAYSSTVPWLKGRPAWVADYAAYYGTSKHFIARSLNGSADYFNQVVSAGSKFNVFRKDKKLQFHLVIDVDKLKLGLYYYDMDTKERVLLKTYSIGLGRKDSLKPSGTLTPLGVYALGDKIAIYSPGVVGFFHDQKTEMIRVFGTRWIPFGQALEGATEPAKGYGIHGVPWIVDAKTNQLVENKECVGKYESDGCIRLLNEDVEEIFAIVITKPTFVHIVKHFQDANLPGIEVATPTR